jgi:putative acetyltransferase
MIIRTSRAQELTRIQDVMLAAFDKSERETVAALVAALLEDASARPLLSLVAETDSGRLVAHILFTAVRLSGSARDVRAAILAPLAVHPDFQSQGLGGRLIEEGVRRLGESGVQLVFVLGHPGYYPRFGFQPAGDTGLAAPYPIAEENAAAWMVRDLQGDLLGRVQGQVQCADALNRPELWCE